MGGGNKGMMDSCTHKTQVNEYLVHAYWQVGSNPSSSAGGGGGGGGGDGGCGSC